MAEEETMFTSKPKLDAWLHDQIQKRMKETGEGYRQAMNAVAHENPALMAVREGLYMQEGRRPINAKTYSLVNGKLVEIESQIERLIEAAKREHAGMDHNGAFRLVASEHRDLFQVRETLWGFIHG